VCALGGAFAPGPFANDDIQASDFTALIAALDQARSVYGLAAFEYAGVTPPISGGEVFAKHVLQLREVMK
jgi:hypothetical protein